jgi:hypothetical protein
MNRPMGPSPACSWLKNAGLAAHAVSADCYVHSSPGKLARQQFGKDLIASAWVTREFSNSVAEATVPSGFLTTIFQCP